MSFHFLTGNLNLSFGTSNYSDCLEEENQYWNELIPARAIEPVVISEPQHVAIQPIQPVPQNHVRMIMER